MRRPYHDDAYTRHTGAREHKHAKLAKELQQQRQHIARIMAREPRLSRAAAEQTYLAQLATGTPKGGGAAKASAARPQPKLATQAKHYRVCFDLGGMEHGACDSSLRVELQDVAFAYPSTDAGADTGGVPLFSGVTLDVNCSTRAVLVGANGVGKSTLLRLIKGELAPSCGVRTGHPRLRLCHYHQHFDAVLPEGACEAASARSHWRAPPPLPLPRPRHTVPPLPRLTASNSTRPA